MLRVGARIALLLALLAGAGLGVFVLSETLRKGAGNAEDADVAAPPADEPRLGPYPASQFLIEHDLFLSATDPRTVLPQEADHLLPEDEVFGVVVRGAARAYPVTMLSYHHVVNDVIRGIPVAITY